MKIHRSFRDLARFLSGNDETETADEPDGQPEDIVAQLARLRVSPDDFPGLGEHCFSSAPDLSRRAEEIHAGISSSPWSEIIDETVSLLAEMGTSPLVLSPRGEMELVIERGDYPQLPPDYGFKGGVARKALARALELNANTWAVRDMDIVHFGSEPQAELDEQLGKSFMQDDWLFARGNIIELVPNLKAYLKTRDFTVNEVLLIDGRVNCSVHCILDFVAGIIRPTANHLTRNDGFADSSLAYKALRFMAEEQACGRQMALQDFRLMGRKSQSKFFLDLNLDRCLERSEKIARLFLDYCDERQLLPLPLGDYIATLAERMANLQK